jgi:hypothetical protein
LHVRPGLEIGERLQVAHLHQPLVVLSQDALVEVAAQLVEAGGARVDDLADGRIGDLRLGHLGHGGSDARKQVEEGGALIRCRRRLGGGGFLSRLLGGLLPHLLLDLLREVADLGLGEVDVDGDAGREHGERQERKRGTTHGRLLCPSRAV